MKPGTRIGPALLAAAAAFFSLAGPAAAEKTGEGDVRLSISPPPAWADASAEKLPGVLLRLEGPSGSSFAVTKIHPLDLDNHAAVQAFLNDVLGALARKTGLALTADAAIKEKHFGNGVRAELLGAKISGSPRLILAAGTLRDLDFLAVLDSSIPDLMLDETLGALKIAGAEGSGLSAPVLSSDGRLAFDIPKNFRAAPIADSDRAAGTVLVIEGLRSRMSVKTLAGPKVAAAKDPPTFLRSAAAADPDVSPDLIGPVRISRAPTGPALCYLSAGVAGEGALDKKIFALLTADGQDYLIAAAGPGAKDLLLRTFQGLSMKSEQERPQTPRSDDFFYGEEIALGIAFIGALWFWLKRRAMIG